jgi:hypothetical protein
VIASRFCCATPLAIEINIVVEGLGTHGVVGSPTIRRGGLRATPCEFVMEKT